MSRDDTSKGSGPAGEPGIRISRNGPYAVTGNVPLTEWIIGIDDQGFSFEWRAGKSYPTRETYALCRCGRSGTRPFCDGTHTRIGFDGTENAGRKLYLEQAERVVGPGLELTDAQDLCASARFCDRAGGIWRLTKKSRDLEACRTAIEEAANCPSGRLVVWDKQGNPIEPELEPSIGLVEDPKIGKSGPVWVRGRISVQSADGYVYEVRNRVTLCRCGRSGNKPFCDGSHTSR